MSQVNNQLETKKQKDITVHVLERIETFQSNGEIQLPKDYSPANALKSAYVTLSELKKDGKPALEYCTKESIAGALLKMVVLGLSPLKKQGDFIMYGDRLEFSPEYTGNIVLAKRFGGLKDIRSNAIFKGDDFDFEVDPNTGRKKILKHKPTLESIGSKDVIGAYAIMEFVDGSFDVEVMSIEQIKMSWGQGAMKGNSPAHRNFPDQMAIKTVINRACKLLIRGSNDGYLVGEDETQVKESVVEAEVSQEIEINANTEVIDFEEVEQKQTTEKQEQSQMNFEEGPGF